MAATPSPVETVSRYLRAATSRDIDAAAAVVAEDVDVRSGTSTGHGRDEFRAWLLASSDTVQPLRWFAREDRVLVELLLTSVPRDPERGVPHVAVRAATTYTVRDALITKIEHDRHVDRAHAMAGLESSDEVDAPA